MEKELKVLKDEVRALHVSFIQWTLTAVLNSGFYLSCFYENVVIAQVFLCLTGRCFLFKLVKYSLEKKIKEQVQTLSIQVMLV